MRVLVTGSKGRFSNCFAEYVKSRHPEMEIERVSLRNDEWTDGDFGKYDVILHAAGITRTEKGRESLFTSINVDLTRKVAEKTFSDGARQFIYLSSMAIYDGIEWGFGSDGCITENTQPIQSTAYGASKWQAEQAIKGLNSNITRVAIVRPPSIVGPGMEDYFKRYIQYAKIPFIPIPWIHTEAKRSFIYSETLAEFICNLIREEREGVFFPQQLPQLSVCEMMDVVCNTMGNKKTHSRIMGEIIPYSIQKRFFSQICYSDELTNRTNSIRETDIYSRGAIEIVVKDSDKEWQTREDKNESIS